MRIAWNAVIVCLCLIVSTSSAPAAEPAKNLLFFGNSFTIGNDGWNVPRVVKELAAAAGHPAPTVVMQASGGWKLSDHIGKINADGTSSVVNALPTGQQWDAFVMQDYSTRATLVTAVGGNRAGHRADAVTLAGKVLAHSAGAVPVLFQTWARSPGHSYYPAYYADAAAMQTQIRDGYALSAGDLNAVLGAGTAIIAPVGDAFEAGSWTNLYGGDLYHANNRGSLLAGLVIYAQIYGDLTTSNIDLSSIVGGMGLTGADGAALAAIADSVVPEPSAAALLTAGFGALAIRRRRGSIA